MGDKFEFNNDLTLQIAGRGTVPALSAAGKGKIYLDTGSNSFQVSVDGGAYEVLGGGRVAADHKRQAFVTAGGETIFTLGFNYPTDGESLWVFQNGILMSPGGVDYTENNENEVTFVAPRPAAARIVFILLDGPMDIEHNRTTITSGAAQTIFDFGFSYTADTKSLYTFQNGLLMQPGGANDYTEVPSPDSITFNSGRGAGAVITGMAAQADAATLSYERETQVVAGSPQSVFTLGSEYPQDAKTLLVFHNGALMSPGGVDYNETSSSSITFVSPRPVAAVITFIAAVGEGSLSGGSSSAPQEVTFPSGTPLNVAHNRGYFPIIQVLDASNNIVDISTGLLTITHNSNKLEFDITFGAPFAGTVLIL